MSNREKALEYLDEIENMLIRMECHGEYKQTDVLAVSRCCYWLFKEYLRLEQRYDNALERLERYEKHGL